MKEGRIVMATIYYTEMKCPLGTLVLESDGKALTRVRLPGEPKPAATAGKGKGTGKGTGDADRVRDPKPFAVAIAQLQEYFAGDRRKFDLPLAPHGTPFQLKVWRELRKIPYGRTISYAVLAHRAGNDRACRAVGAANGRNPLPIIVPCHRVIGANGSLTGFGGGIEAKRRLLKLEGAAVVAD
jgi:methylated-DNA-[protein]-cysteine S-methyltransferase